MYPGAHDPSSTATIMVGSHETMTYGELDRRSTSLARHWLSAGIGPGDGVAIVSDNSLWYHVVYWAALRSGLYLTPVNRSLGVDEVAYILEDCGARALVASESRRDLAAEAADRIGCRHRLTPGPPDDRFGTLEEAAGDHPVEPLTHQPRGALMCYSSGTTGRPKGIRRPLTGKQIDDPSLVASMDLFVDTFAMTPQTRYLSPAPLHHAAPLAWTSAVQSVGGTVFVMERFDPTSALAALEDHAISHSQWVPTMFVRMLKLAESERRGRDLRHHRYAVHAAAPCPIEVKVRMLDWWGPIIWEYYAATESNGATVISPDEWLARPGSVGRPLFGELHICDDQGREVPTGETGLVYFGQPDGAFEYHKDPDRTLATRNPRQPTWSTIGDIGHVDDDGYLYLTDRAAFTIISGGVNIYPREIEDCLVMHPKVADIAVFGVPDPDMGEAVHADVEPSGAATDPEGLIAELTGYAAQRIAPYKVPRSMELVTELPRSATGKLLKGPLRDRFWGSSADRDG